MSEELQNKIDIASKVINDKYILINNKLTIVNIVSTFSLLHEELFLS